MSKANIGDMVEVVRNDGTVLIGEMYKVEKMHPTLPECVGIEYNGKEHFLLDNEYKIVGVAFTPTNQYTTMPLVTFYGDSVDGVKSYTNVCECGAQHTEFPNHHYDWCPMYKEEKEEKSWDWGSI